MSSGTGKVPKERIKHFMWLVMHDRILCNAERFRRHLTSDQSCPRCSAAIEDEDHVLRHCFFPRQIWLRVINKNTQQAFFNMEFKNWFLANLSGKTSFGCNDDWQYVFGVSLWKIWQWRNQSVLGSKESSMACITLDIQRQVDYIKVAHDNHSRHHGQILLKKDTWISWKCPPVSWVKINTDDAYSSVSGIAKAGGIIRNDCGNWVGGFSTTIGQGSVLEAEFRGVFHGLQLGWSLGLRKIILEIDSLTVVKKITDRSDAAQYSNIVAAIRAFIDRDWEVEICHIYREANYAADHLASLGDDFLIGFQHYEFPPPSVLPWIRHDLYGVAYCRDIQI